MDSHDRVVTGIGSPNSGCDVHAALANERDHITALRRRDSDADKVNPLGLPIGLALSGGGIRSATVCLGAVQALAESRLLRRFDYLSTVSGGGYIGCWLSAILRGHGRTLPAGEAIGAVEELIAPSEIRKKDEEPAEIAFLRAYSNYLTPRLGLFSSDTLAALTGYLRNLFLSLLLAVFSVGSLLAVLHLLVFVVTLEAKHPFLQEVSSFAAKFLLGLSAALAALLLTLQALDVRSELPDGKHRGAILFGLQVVQRAYGNVMVLAVALGLMAAGTRLETQLPFTIDYFDALQVSFYALLLFGFGAFLAHALIDLTSEVTDKIDIGKLVVRMISMLWNWKEFAFDWLMKNWQEALRYAFAALSCSFVAYKLIGLCGALDRVDPIVALFRGPALAVAISLVIFVVWLGVVGTTYSEPTREWLSRLMGSLVGVVLAWLAIGAILINARPLMYWLFAGRWHFAIQATWLIATALFLLLAVLVARSRPATPSASISPGNRVVAIIVPMACIVVIVIFLATMTSAFQELLVRTAGPLQIETLLGPTFEALRASHLTEISGAMGLASIGPIPSEFPPAWESATSVAARAWSAIPVLSLILASLLGTVLAFRYVDVNVFSLQNLYRNRLVRCYLGAAHHTQRLQNPYAGFDPADDIALSSLKEQRPFHLISAALNITQGDDLAWQQRKAASFCFSPLWSGYWLEAANLAGLVAEDRVRGGFAKTDEYALEPSGQGGEPPALMLGTAMATSGAAVSSQMGFASRGVLAFVLTLLNVRLGRWFPNTTGAKLTQNLGRHSPRSAGVWYLSELLGRTNEKSAWIYLSDGGHFENLGIYELVRRRCRFIVAVDAGADPAMAFGDLGNCVRKCRVDFGVSIKIDLAKFAPAEGTTRPPVSYVLGKVHYPRAGDKAQFTGDILYMKSCVPSSAGQVPADLLSFLAENRLFPHQSTSDQWFTESQFESYRQLGYWLTTLALPSAHEVFGAIARPSAQEARQAMATSTPRSASHDEPGDPADHG